LFVQLQFAVLDAVRAAANNVASSKVEGVDDLHSPAEANLSSWVDLTGPAGEQAGLGHRVVVSTI
jgi:hypothetical protein